MKVKANFKFNDLQEGKIRMKGMSFNVSEERARTLAEKTHNGVPFVTIMEEENKQTAPVAKAEVPTKAQQAKQDKEAQTTKEDKDAVKRTTK